MLINEYSLIILIYIFAAYVVCGVVKGSIGFGLPTVSISLLAFLIDVKLVIALILIPTLIINIYQLCKGGNLKKISDLVVHIKSKKGDYGPVEDNQLIINHILAHWFQQNL